MKIIKSLRISVFKTDHVIETWRLHLDVVDKKETICKIIDFAIPGDRRIEDKVKDNKEKYQDLGRELQKIWNVKVKIIPFVVGPLDAIPKQLGNRLKQIGIKAGTTQIQKTLCVIIIIELTHSKTILEINVEIEPQPAALISRTFLNILAIPSKTVF